MPSPRRPRHRAAPAFVAFALALAAAPGAGGCGDDDGDDAPKLTWGACGDPAFQSMDECGTLTVPLDWDAPGGEKINVFVARTRATASPARGQLWFLQGGPGSSGAVFAERSAEGQADSLVDDYHAAFPDFDLYVIDHRGVGLSTRLGCPDFEREGSEAGAALSGSETPKCLDAVKAQWGERLRFFSSQAAARDLAAATDVTRAPDQALYVYSVSYGTYWAIQYLKARPADATGVVLDSIATPGVQFFNDFGLQPAKVAEKLAALCAADALCAQKFGPDPWARALEVVGKVRQGQCFDGLKAADAADVAARGGDPATDGSFPDVATYANVVEQFGRLAIQFRSLNTLLFPLLYRLERCEPADADAVYRFLLEVSRRLDRPDPAAHLDSDMLRLHVGISELYDPAAPPRADIERACDEAPFCSLPIDVVYRDVWPRYAPPADVWQWPDTAVPILAMNGELDPQTPVEKAEQIRGNLRAPTQSFVRVPFGTHAVLINSPVAAPDAATCGRQMIDAFLRDPAAPPATACLSDLLRPSFTRSAEFAGTFFGSGDIWENVPPPAPPAAALVAARRGPLRPPARPDRLHGSPPLRFR
jgi:pimeloyl-ACP methyl ester carboxylesterase